MRLIYFILLLILFSCKSEENTNYLLNEKKYLYFFVNSDTVCYEKQYKNGIIDGYSSVYVNNKLIKKQYINNGDIDGEFKMYYLNGNLMYEGEFKNGGLCYLNIFDDSGELGGEDFFCEIFAQSDKDNVNMYIDFVKHNFLEERDFTYAFYQITNDMDTINVMPNSFDIIEIRDTTTLYTIPFNYDHKGKYLFKFLIYSMSINDYYYYPFTAYLNFEFDENGVLKSECFKTEPIKVKLPYPYMLIIDTTIIKSFDTYLNKETLILTQMTPYSNHNRENILD